MVLVCVGIFQSAVVCCDFGSREVARLREREEILKIRGDFFLSLYLEVKESGSMYEV
jgi:hypothetical protein